MWDGATARRRASVRIAAVASRLLYGPPNTSSGPSSLTAAGASIVSSGSGLFLDRVDAISIEGEMVLNRRDRFVRSFVGPHGVRRARAAGRDAVIGAVALVGAVGRVVGAGEQRHIDIFARDVEHRRI